MDAPRRWQVVSVATAVVGLGVGGVLVGRSPSQPVAPIQLESPAGISTPVGEEGGGAPDDPSEVELVRPRVVEVPGAPVSDDAAGSAGAPPAVEPPASGGSGSAPDDSPDSPDEVDSPESPDSAD